MLSPTLATTAAPAKPDRARLVAQLKNLESLIAKLDLEEQQEQDKDKGRGKEEIKLNKRMRKMLARKEQENGPLPPSLANAPKRHVALLFSYEGWAYSGLAYQPKGVYTPLPTVEGTLLAALEKARLIEPIDEGEGFGCGFERCGRTDAGVSSSAQVVNLWVRSDLDDPMLLRGRELDPDSVEGRRHARSRSPSRERARSDSEASSSSSSSPQRPPKARNDVEIPYVTLLNKHLPPSIRIHAWSPVSATFSSRYSCIWRHYKYFFSTSPAHALLATRFDFGAAYKAAGLYPEHASPDWKDRLARVNWHGLELDVELMKDAVGRLVGEHDFRNFCKVDPPKQLPIHVRTVISATIDPLEGEGDDMFVLNLRGGAFVSRAVRSRCHDVEPGAWKRHPAIRVCIPMVCRSLPHLTRSSTTRSATSSRSSSSSAPVSNLPRLSTASSGPRTVPLTPSRLRSTPPRARTMLPPAAEQKNPPMSRRSRCSIANPVTRSRPTSP